MKAWESAIDSEELIIGVDEWTQETPGSWRVRIPEGAYIVQVSGGLVDDPRLVNKIAVVWALPVYDD